MVFLWNFRRIGGKFGSIRDLLFFLILSPMSKLSSKAHTRVSLKDIAARAQVSIGSVSSVLNNRHLERRIPQETAQKIRDTAAKLGYLPNISARRLRSSEGVKNALVLALITSFEAPITLVNHFVAALHREIEGVGKAKNQSLSLLIEMFNAGRLKEMPGLLSGDHFNAAIILNTIAEDDDFLARTHLPFPVVLVNRSIAGYPCVVEHEGTGARAAELLVRRKRKRLAVIHGSPLTQSTENRVNGFQRRSTELLGIPAEEIIAEKLSGDTAYDAVKFYLAHKGIPFDGLYAASDALALGAYRAIREQGLKIPHDVAVLGVGDYEISRYFDPPLACVGVSHTELAQTVIHLLMTQLRSSPSIKRISLPLHEVLGGSYSAS